jgi:hypothetical protein
MSRATDLRSAVPHASASFLRLNKMAAGEPADLHTHDPHDVKGSSTDYVGFFKANGIREPVAEYRFHKTRKWRFDYAWPDFKVALEVEGGVWTGGRHTRGAGFLKDIEKYNAAGVAGWTVLRCTPDGLYTPTTVAMLREVLP